MPRYGAGVSPAGINTANTAYANLVGGTGDRLLVVRIVVNIAVAPTTAPSLYLARTTARGTQASTLAGQVFDAGDVVSIGTLDVCGTGASQPTFTNTNKIDVGGLAVTAGGSWVWTFYDKPLIVPATAGAGLAVANANASGATTGTFLVSYTWDE
jgi:hypothetical protein